ncbi:MAG TPA: ABC transporter permease [Lachnospiraceae bacterium]|nr:ABC transporter permease [Lachnospiraceae bacterium]
MKSFKLMTIPYIIWSIIMIILPMVMILFYAFITKGNSVRQFIFTFDNFLKFFSDPVFFDVLKRSVYIALITTLFCIILGYPVAYIIARAKPKTSAILVLLVTLPTWINMLVRTYAWRSILQENGIAVALLTLMGIKNVKLIETEFAVILGMVYNFIPFMILQIYNSLSKLDENYLTAAADLGANRVQTFLRITLPLSVPGIVSGITLVFLPAVSSFFIPKLLGGGQFVMIGNVIENQFLTAGNWSFGSAISLIMAILIIISMYITRRLDAKITGDGGDDK